MPRRRGCTTRQRSRAPARDVDGCRQDADQRGRRRSQHRQVHLPDRILLADTRPSAADWAIIRSHPGHGAHVLRQIDGYGPVAEIVLCHHERIDGTGYPGAIRGEDIPLLSRMISIADTYDVMTARDSYRDPIPPSEAIVELRRVSGTQLDAHLVELFIGLLERRGVAFRHADDADFEAELRFDARVRDYARREPVAA